MSIIKLSKIQKAAGLFQVKMPLRTDLFFDAEATINSTNAEVFLLNGTKVSGNSKWGSILGNSFIIQNANQRIQVYQHPEELGSLQDAKLFFRNFVANRIKQKESYTMEELDDILHDGIIYRAVQIKNKIQELDGYIFNLKQQIKNQEDILQIIDDRVEKSGRRALWGFTSVVFAQLCLVQWATYIQYSWDVVEPFTCLMGLSDATIAYIFWMLSGRSDYGQQGIYGYFKERKYKKLCKKYKIDSVAINKLRQDISDLEKIRDQYHRTL